MGIWILIGDCVVMFVLCCVGQGYMADIGIAGSDTDANGLSQAPYRKYRY